MKLLITGSRLLNTLHYGTLDRAIRENYPNVTEIMTGGAQGADKLAERWARTNGIKYSEIKPDYKQGHYKKAPLLRNLQLVKQTEATLALYYLRLTGGTKHTAQASRKAGHRTVIVEANSGATTLL